MVVPITEIEEVDGKIVEKTVDYDPEESMLDFTDLKCGFGIWNLCGDISDVKVEMKDLKTMMSVCATLLHIIGNNAEMLDNGDTDVFGEATDAVRLIGNKYLKGSQLRREEQSNFDAIKQTERRFKANDAKAKKTLNDFLYGYYRTSKQKREAFITYLNNGLAEFYNTTKHFNID